MASVLSIWQPYFVSLEPFFCQDKKVLKDRLGVGWMLFLPVAITRDQIPEAAQAISRNDEQGRMGTLITSVNNVFDIKKPDHVRAANDIEIRLTDLDLYPTGAQMEEMWRA